MKKVVEQLTVTIPETTFDSLNDDSLVGIKWQKGNKSFISKAPNGLIIGAELSNPDYGGWSKKSVSDYVKSCVEEQQAEIFVFDNLISLLQWLQK